MYCGIHNTDSPKGNFRKTQIRRGKMTFPSRGTTTTNGATNKTIDALANLIKNAGKKWQQISRKGKFITIAALLSLSTIGIIHKCTNDAKPEKDQIEFVENVKSDKNISQYADITDSTTYTVESGDNLSTIADKHNVSLIRLKACNPEISELIHPGDTIKIPTSYTVRNIDSIQDISAMLGIKKEFIDDMCNFETKSNEIYTDKNGNKTIGIGHLVKSNEISKYSKGINDNEVYTLFAQDLLNCDMNLEAIIGKSVYSQLPNSIRESLIDLAFNKGEGAVFNNENLMKAISDLDYIKIISNINQDYSTVKDTSGIYHKKYSSGLSKRRLYDIFHAAGIYGKKVPNEILEVAQIVYQNGIKYMQKEKTSGHISEAAYPNVLAEYKGLAFLWSNGKIGEKIDLTNIKTEDTQKASNETSKEGDIVIKGTDYTVKTLHDEWEKTKTIHNRPFKRPMPIIDSNGNLKAYVKELKPTGTGKLNGKTIIINPGHGGAMNKMGANGNLNVNFDPGTSNAVMSKSNPNVETNQFIGNNERALEEWYVNQNFANDLTKKIRAAGGTVIYVQGSVYCAQDAIREAQKNKKIDLIISLHSNSEGPSKRGINVIASKTNGVVDEKDKDFADLIVEHLEKDDWFKGITKSSSQSLGVLKSDKTTNSPVPGVLIETGNLKNTSDIANLNSSAFRNKLINGVYDSIVEYISK